MKIDDAQSETGSGPESTNRVLTASSHELASPPLEGVYVRACTGRVTPNQH